MKEEDIRLLKLIEMSGLPLDKVNSKKAALFYVLANSKNLFNQVNMIYDFKNNRLNLDFDEEGNIIFGHIKLTHQEEVLLNLVLQIYNNLNNLSVRDIFSKLDNNNRMIALETIKMGFGIYNKEYVKLEESEKAIDERYINSFYCHETIEMNLKEREFTEEYKKELEEIESKLLGNNDFNNKTI